MLFGLCNAAATFRRPIHTALIGISSQYSMLRLDGILVFNRDTLEHSANLKSVLVRLQYRVRRLTQRTVSFCNT